ncbi:MAG: hypothetical protein M3441_21495 [Chloroflexota bacterium]|nr:hypothetical protein [Chloroflexota bacterium]
MDRTDRADAHQNAEQAERLDEADAGTAQGPAAAGIISANLAGLNTGLSTMATAAPSAGNVGGVSGAQAEGVMTGDEDLAEDAALNLDVLEQFGSKHRQTGDDGVSPEQKEIEADELNG